MMDKLMRIYEDTSHSLQFCYEQLKRIKPVKYGDYTGLVKMVNDIECIYSQLADIGKVGYLSLHEIDNLADLLPSNIHWEGLEVHQKLDESKKIKPQN